MGQDVIGHENHGGIKLLIVGALLAISGRLAPCQTCFIGASLPVPITLAPSEQMPAYEVATIKPWDGQGFDRSSPVRIYIQQAFGISPNLINRVIGPDWIKSTRYVIQAKPPDSMRDAMQTMTAAERRLEDGLMMQSLLADRFQLKAHFETREMPGYQLVLAKAGSKLKENPDPAKHRLALNPTSFRETATTIQELIQVLECSADVDGREVIDKTGLAGTYDISLKWTPFQTAAAPGDGTGTAPSPDVEGASLFTAIQEQLGLKLVPTNGPGRVLVIERIEHPSEN